MENIYSFAEYYAWQNNNIIRSAIQLIKYGHTTIFGLTADETLTVIYTYFLLFNEKREEKIIRSIERGPCIIKKLTYKEEIEIPK